MAGELHLAVQQASSEDVPDRQRVRRWVAAALRVERVRSERPRSASLTVRFVDRDEGRALNRSYRGKDYATNVLTFPYVSTPDRIHADLVVCLPVVRDEAREQRKPYLAHCAHLVIHGTLHAAGHDHAVATETEAMEKLERTALRSFRIADPYVTR